MAERNAKCRKKRSSEVDAIHPVGGWPRLRNALEFFRFFRFFRLNCCFRVKQSNASGSVGAPPAEAGTTYLANARRPAFMRSEPKMRTAAKSEKNRRTLPEMVKEARRASAGHRAPSAEHTVPGAQLFSSRFAPCASSNSYGGASWHSNWNGRAKLLSPPAWKLLRAGSGAGGR